MKAPPQGARSSLARGINTEPCDRVVFATNDVVAGEFRCPTTYPGFLTAGRINHYIVAFPRTAVWIERETAPRFVADPSFATIYNPGQPYLRHLISPDGDLSDWLGISERLAREAVRRFDPGHADHPEPLRHVRAPVSNRIYLAQRVLFTRLAMADVDALEAEERTLSIVVDVLRSAYAPTGREVCAPHRGRPRRDLVESTKAALMSRLFENTGIGDLARDVDVSPFHLCRSFRAETGKTLHEYRRDIRLRTALGLTESYRGNLSALALRAGFYSHSHFTTAFRRAFGLSPSIGRRS